jgi:hypothetical protein
VSHAASLLAILTREQARKDRRTVKFADLHAVIRQSHETRRNSAALIERSEALMGWITKRG